EGSRSGSLGEERVGCPLCRVVDVHPMTVRPKALYALRSTTSAVSVSAPNRTRPDSAIGVAKDGNRTAPSRRPGLARCMKGLDQEHRQISPGPNPKPRDGHEGDRLITLPDRGQPILLLAIALPADRSSPRGR